MAEKKVKKKYVYQEIRVRGVDPQVKTDLENIAENSDIEFMIFMRREIKLIRDKFPKELRIKKDKA
jgi:hypothetical protein